MMREIRNSLLSVIIKKHFLLIFVFLSFSTCLFAVTEFKCNIKSSGGDYAGVNAWSTAVRCDLTASTTQVFSISANSGTTIEDGAAVTGLTSGATGTCIHVSQTTNNSQILIKNIVGTFSSGEIVQKTADASRTVTLSSIGDTAIASAVCFAFQDSTGTTIDANWTTSATNYVYIYTDSTARHAGVWDAAKYMLAAASGITVSTLYAKIEGLQIRVANGSWGYGIKYAPANAGWIKIFKNIIRANSLSGATDNTKGLWLTTWNATDYVYNNIIYDFTNGATNHVGIKMDAGTLYAYNNTVQNCYLGFTNGGMNVSAYCKNNITQDCTDGFWISGGYSWNTTNNNYNISDLSGDAPGTNSLNLTIVSFKDKSNDDFHLSADDTVAKNTGVSLITLFTDDVEGKTRKTTWDIGADGLPDVPTVTTIEASTGVNITATTVTITGTGFYGEAGSNNVSQIKLDDAGSTAITTYTVDSNIQISGAVIPAGITAGTYSVLVKNDGGANTTSTTKFTVTTPPPPTVSGVTPAGSFNNTAARTLTITGTGYFGGTGTSRVTAVSVNGTALTLPDALSITDVEIPGIIMPAGIGVGTYNISVSAIAGNGTGTDLITIVTDVPAVTVLDPSFGGDTGNTTISIQGTGFWGGVLSSTVTSIKLDDVGTTALTGYSVVSNILITGAVVPPGLPVANTYNVIVTTAGGSSVTTASTAYTVLGGPTVTDISAVTGSNLNPVTITITGTNFISQAGVVSIKFDDAVGTNFTKPGSGITGTLIPGAIIPTGIAVGSYNVIVTTTTGSNLTSTKKFGVTTDAPLVSGITPAGSINNTAARTLTVTGTGFTGGTGTSTVTAVSVNGTLLTLPGSGITSTSIPGLIMPAGKAIGTYSILVEATTGSGTGTNLITVVTDVPVISSVTPAGSINNTAVRTLTITGTGFTGGTGTSTVTAVSVNGTALTLPGSGITSTSIPGVIMPGGIGIGTYSILVSATGGNGTGTNLITIVTDAPVISSVTPLGSFNNTSAKTLTVTGTGFHGGTGASTVSAISVNGTALTLPGAGNITNTIIRGAIMPSGIPVGTYNILVTAAGGTGTGAQLVTITSPAPTVTNIGPSTNANSGATTISIVGTNFFAGGSSRAVTGITMIDLGTTVTTTITGYNG